MAEQREFFPTPHAQPGTPADEQNFVGVAHRLCALSAQRTLAMRKHKLRMRAIQTTSKQLLQHRYQGGQCSCFLLGTMPRVFNSLVQCPQRCCCRAGLSAIISDAVQIDTRQARPEPNPAVTGQLVANARRPPSTKKSAAVHYYAKTTYRTNWFYIFLYSLSILASLVYFVVRVIYIATGKKSVHIPLNTTIVVDGDNVTVAEALNDRVAIGEEIPESLLDRPRYSDLKAVRHLPHFCRAHTGCLLLQWKRKFTLQQRFCSLVQQSCAAADCGR